MKLREFLVVFLISTASVAIAATNNSLIVMTPSVWLCDESWNQSILVDLLPNSLNTDNLKLELLIRNKQDADKFVKLEETVDRTGFKKIQFNLPSSFESGTYLIEVKATGNNDYYFNDTFKYIDCQTNENGLYIITDKPVYRDAENVRIKIVNIDSYLLPVSSDIASIYIMDPNGNTIAQFLNVTFKDGLIEDLSLRLGDRPIYGDWKIRANVDNTDKEISFTVKEYVLPRFDINIDVPTYILKSSKQIEVNVDAKYTYGQPLPGSVNVELKNQYFDYSDPNWNPQNNEIISYFKNFELTNGKAKILIPFSSNSKSYFYRLNVTVIEQFTNESVSKEVYLNLVNEEFYANMESYNFVPNKLNTIKIKLNYRNDKPYADKNVNVELIEKFNYSTVLDNQTFSLRTDLDGKLVVQKEIGNASSVEIKISLADDPTQSAYVYLSLPFVPVQDEELSNQTELVIKLADDDDELQYDSLVRLNITKLEAQSNKCYDARYFIISRLQIFNENVIKICDQVEVDVNLTTLYAPYSTFVIYFVDDNKNVTASSFELNIVNFYRNDLKIEFGKNVTEPGEAVEVKLKTKPGSLVALSIIDKSLELLQTPNELTKTDISYQINKFRIFSYFPIYEPSELQPMRRFWFGTWKRSQALISLNDAGLIVVSDLEDLKATFENGTGPVPVYMANDMMGQGGFGSIDSSPAPRPTPEGSVAKESTRSDFRETWIWETFTVGNDSEKSIFSKIPDTITTWVASGFSLNHEYGIAIADKQQIKTFKGFFVSMILPPSMIRGEILTLQCIVYNYMNEDLKDVRVVFGKTDDFKLIQKNNNEQKSVDIDEDITRVIDEIKSQTSKLVEFQITPSKVGQLPLTVRAVSKVAGDGETKKLKVKPEGIQETINQAVLVDLRNDHQIVQDFHIRIPQNRIDDSEHCTVQIIGDLLGPSLNNLNRLINKPFGCGEQNMVTLTPNIYALKYLLASSAKNSQIKNVDKLIVSAKDNILFGYQNELKYFRRDGSFSAFGDSDNHGSTWLTAFVVKSFAQATEYVKIDDKVLSKAVDFLISQQNEDGSFKEPGKVIHQDMQGGANGKTSITAYVTIALIESKLNEESIIKSIEQATAYLQKEIKNLTDDVYTLGLATFALNLAKSDKAKQYFDIFQSKSINSKDGNIYWSKSPNTDSSSDIELTAYGLLLNLLQNDVSTSLSIVKYLIGKSNSLGTYSNTQNTVLALQALSQFGVQVMLNDRASSTEPSNINLNVNLIEEDDESDEDDETSKQFNVNEENSIVLQTWELPDCEGKVNLNASGNGIALFQLMTTYNVPNVTEPKTFDLKQETLETNGNVLILETCATYYQQSSPNKQQSTGMTLIEASLLSGHEVDKQELQKLVEEKTIEYLKLIEVKDEKVVFYLDQLDDATPVCIEWKMFKVNKVDNLKPVPVRVYDYYQNNLQYDILYSV